MNRLIVFAKAPVEGRVKTRLARETGRAAALRLYEAMVADRARFLRETFKGEVFWYVEGDPAALAPLLADAPPIRPQAGADLGERMKNAFAEVFAEGPGPVAILGTDSPELSADDLASLFHALAGDADAVVIPSGDGGYSALALARRCDAAFNGIAWSTSETLSRTLEKLATSGLSTTLLPCVDDVDTAADLLAAAGRARDGKNRVGPALSALLDAYGLGAIPECRVVDDLGRAVAASPPPARIVSLVPSVTEALFDLGAGGKIVGRTDYCISPSPEVERIPSVGGPKTFDPDAVLALRPDLVFADAEENDRARVERLINEGVRVFVALPRTLADVSAFLRRAGLLLGAKSAGEAAAEDLDRLTPGSGLGQALCLVWLEPLMAASPMTLTGSLLEAAGFTCLALPGSSAPYPALGAEELAALRPGTLLLPSEPWPFTPQEAGTLRQISGGARVLLFPGEWVTWYGARTRANVEKLAALAERDCST